MPSAARSVSSRPAQEAAHVLDEVAAVDLEAEEVRQLADHDGHGESGHVAQAHWLREQVGDEAETGRTGADGDEPDEDGKGTGQARRPRCRSLPRAAG